MPIPLPFSLRVTTSVAVFNCLFIASPQGAQQFSSRAFVPIASDSFQRPNEAPLNPIDWTIGVDSTGLAVLNDLCVGREISGDAEYYTGATVLANQSVSIVVNQFGISSEINCYVRTNATTLLGGYQAFFFGNGVGGYGIFLYGGTGGGFIASYTLPRAPQAGDTLTLSAVGAFISVIFNGTVVITTQDPAYPTGITGMGIKFTATPADTSVSSFTTGNLVPTSMPSGTTIAALQLSYAQLTTLYQQLRQQDIPNQEAVLDTLIASAIVTVSALQTTVDGLAASTPDGSVILQGMQSVVANALASLKAAQGDEATQAD